MAAPSNLNTLHGKVIAAIASREPKTSSTGETVFRCPYPAQHENGDRHPSARFNPDKEVWTCDPCGNGGGITDLARALGIKPEPMPNGAVVDATY